MIKWNRIGYGTWPLAGDANGAVSYGKVEKKTAEVALKEALDYGINFFDTSDFYGYGYVERMLGEIFYDFRTEIVIATKGGMLDNDGKQDFSEGYLYSALVGSLFRLQTTYVDVYMLHSPPIDILEDSKVIDILRRFKKAGWIKEYGISLAKPNDGFRAINDYGFKIIEVNYNILDHRAEDSGLFALCKEKGVKTIIRTPLGQGVLSGEFEYNDDAADRRNQLPKSLVDRQKKIFRKMMAALNENNYSDAKNCLRFCLSNDAVTTIIPGMKAPNEVLDNATALYAPRLTEEELARIKAIYKEENL